MCRNPEIFSFWIIYEFFLTPPNWSAIFLKYFWDISEIFLRYFWNIFDYWGSLLVDFSKFLLVFGGNVATFIVFLRFPAKIWKNHGFPKFSFFSKHFSKIVQKKQKFIGIYREGCVWSLPRLVPQIFEKKMSIFLKFLRKTVIFPDFQIFPHIFKKSDNCHLKKNKNSLVFAGKGVLGLFPHIFRKSDNFHFFSKKIIGIYRERWVWALPRLVPQIFEKNAFLIF